MAFAPPFGSVNVLKGQVRDMEAIFPAIITAIVLAYLSAGMLSWLKGRWRRVAWALIGLYAILHLATVVWTWSTGDLEHLIAVANRLFLEIAGLAIVCGISWGFGAVVHIARATRDDRRRARQIEKPARD